MAGIVIAVDGPAASGKGTVASALAEHYGLPYLDTGLLYRGVGIQAVRQGVDLDDRWAMANMVSVLNFELDDAELRTRAAGEAASRVAVHPEVRSMLVRFQRQYAESDSGAVLDGRDIGTVIAPHAPAKLFVTASPQVRATRRWKQLVGQGETVSFEDVMADIARRDARDSGRAAAPLVQAADAHLLDTSEMTIEHAFREARRLVEQALGR
jgi:cytidylate kinase